MHTAPTHHSHTAYAGDCRMLEAQGLACRRGGRLLFSDCGLRVAAGEALHITGANGSGKTSLLRILAGLGGAQAGDVRWEGRDLRECRAEYTPALRFIGHGPGVSPHLTALENLRWSRTLLDAPEACVERALEHMHLAPLADVRVGRLSAGQRQRLALCRLLLGDSKLWLLDEPIAALDAQGVERLQALLTGHLDRGGAVVFTSHQPLELRGHHPAVLAL